MTLTSPLELILPPLLHSLRPRTLRPLLRRSLSTPPPKDSVRIVEVGARDGLQNESSTISLETKLTLLHKLSATGLRHIEAGSFVSPKWVPQMASTPQILASLESSPPPAANRRLTYSYLTPNLQGLNAFLAALEATPGVARSSQNHVNEISIFASASEGFSQKNLNRSVADSLASFSTVAATARSHNLPLRGYVSMVIACPYSGPTPPEKVADVVERLLDMGCYEVSLGDTNGLGTPASVGSLLEYLIHTRGIPVSRLAAHWHDTFGMAVVNCLVAYEKGVRVFDGSVGGLGGCPYAKGATGNVASEDLVYLFEGVGVETGVDLGGLCEVGEWISGVLGRGNGSRVGRAVLARRRALVEELPKAPVSPTAVKAKA